MGDRMARVVALVLALALAACGGGTSAEPSSPATTCAAGAGTCLGTVRLALHDADDAPLASVAVSVCGDELCLRDRTDARGELAIDVARRLSRPVVTVYGGSRWPTLARAIAREGDVDLGVAKLPSLAEDGPAALGDGTKLPSAIVMAGAAPSLVDPAARLDVVVAIEPGDRLSAPATLVLSNVAGWPGCASVDVLANGLANDPSCADGAWCPIATAHVTPDGTAIRCEACLLAPGPLGLRRVSE